MLRVGQASIAPSRQNIGADHQQPLLLQILIMMLVRPTGVRLEIQVAPSMVAIICRHRLSHKHVSRLLESRA